ncbi:MAG: MerR family transcriptional regulator [Bacteroidia bacterium]|nr:MerR family transcriptional regulator [Bacteroidia bacterium]
MEKTEKLFYSIGEVSDMLGVNQSAIRYYIKEFHLKVDRNSKGNHIFREKDIEKLKEIITLTKEHGYTLSGAKEQLKSKNKKEFNKEELKSKLLEIKSKLEQIKREL